MCNVIDITYDNRIAFNTRGYCYNGLKVDINSDTTYNRLMLIQEIKKFDDIVVYDKDRVTYQLDLYDDELARDEDKVFLIDICELIQAQLFGDKYAQIISITRIMK